MQITRSILLLESRHVRNRYQDYISHRVCPLWTDFTFHQRSLSYMLRGSGLPAQSEWVIFVTILVLVGLSSVTLALLPRSWIAKVCRKDRDDEQLFLAPIKWLGGFAAISYLVALLAYLAPHSWNLNTQLMFSLCPLYFVKMTFDPSLVATFLLSPP